MSFNPNASAKKALPTVVSDSAQAFPFLAERVASVGLDPARQQKESDDSRKKTLRTLNALKIVSPILVAVSDRHSVGGSEEATIDTFKRLVGQASDMAERVISNLGEDPSKEENFWLRNMLERAFCEVLRDMTQRGKDVSLSVLEPILKNLAALDLPLIDGHQEFASWGHDTAVRAAIVRGAAPILVKVMGFDFFRTDIDADIEAIMQKIVADVGRATLTMVAAGASEREKSSLFSVLLAEAGQLYASAWNSCGKQVVSNLSNLGDRELKALLAENPKGLPLNKVNESYDKNFSRLVGLSKKLVPQKAGKLDSRMRE